MNMMAVKVYTEQVIAYVCVCVCVYHNALVLNMLADGQVPLKKNNNNNNNNIINREVSDHYHIRKTGCRQEYLPLRDQNVGSSVFTDPETKCHEK